jgi:hypothetical protein
MQAPPPVLLSHESASEHTDQNPKPTYSPLFLTPIRKLTQTDDGLTLSGNLLLEARSDWVRDLLSTGNSLLLRRIADRLGFVGLWAILVSMFFTLSPADWQVEQMIRVPSWPHELIGGFLSILLVFRTDQAYQRFWEGEE